MFTPHYDVMRQTLTSGTDQQTERTCAEKNIFFNDNNITGEWIFPNVSKTVYRRKYINYMLAYVCRRGIYRLDHSLIG